MKNNIFVSLFLFALGAPAYALVSSPSSVNEGEWAIEAKSLMERGKIEPNENTSSFQKAKIDIYQLSLARGIGAPGFGSDHFIRIDYRYFISGKEQVGNQVFYDKDKGNVATFTYGFNFVHEPAYSAGIYASVSPLTDYNKQKFSSPRVDLWSLGIRSGIEITSKFFIENLVHFGSGIPGKQNSYLAFISVAGLKLREAIGFPITLKAGPYAELDLKERTDAAYDAAFSPAGRPDRIRSMKIGVTGSLDVNLSSSMYLSAGYVQKLGGYDAPATNASFASIGMKF